MYPVTKGHPDVPASSMQVQETRMAISKAHPRGEMQPVWNASVMLVLNQQRWIQRLEGPRGPGRLGQGGQVTDPARLDANATTTRSVLKPAAARMRGESVFK